MRLFTRSFLFVLLAALAAARAAAGGEAAPPAAEGRGSGDGSWRDKVVVAPVKGVIVGEPMSAMPGQVMAAIDRAERERARLIVLEIDSPGGEVGICDVLSKRIFESGTPTVALITHKAVSGGAMAASAAREVVMTHSARMGDIQPMQMGIAGPGGLDARSAEKIEVDIRTIMKVYAEGRGRPAAVMTAMVSRDLALYQVVFADGGVGYMDGHELRVHEENLEKGRERRAIASTRIIKPEGRLLELTARQAVEFGVASEAVASAEEFYRTRGIEEDDIVRPAVEEGSFDITRLIPGIDDLGMPVWVLVLLGVFLVVGVAGIAAEFHAPGTGIPAAIGVIGFVCFFSTLLMYDRGSPVGIALFLAGIAALVVEIMVLPGFGVTGVLGILGILSGMFLAFTPDWDSEYMRVFMWAEVGSFTLLAITALTAAALVIWLLAAHGDRLPLVGRLALGRTPSPGGAAVPDGDGQPRLVPSATRSGGLAGRTGVAETTLRPAGKARLDSGELIDVVTDGVFIEAGTRIGVRDEAAPGGIVVVERQG